MTEPTTKEPTMDAKTILLNAAKNLVSDIERGDILTAAWASRRVEELITDPGTLAAYGFKLDSSDIMRPRLVKIEEPAVDLSTCTCDLYTGHDESGHACPIHDAPAPYDPQHTHHPDDVAGGTLPTDTERAQDGDDDPATGRASDLIYDGIGLRARGGLVYFG